MISIVFKLIYHQVWITFIILDIVGFTVLIKFLIIFFIFCELAFTHVKPFLFSSKHFFLPVYILIYWIMETSSLFFFITKSYLNPHLTCRATAAAYINKCFFHYFEIYMKISKSNKYQYPKIIESRYFFTFF